MNTNIDVNAVDNLQNAIAQGCMDLSLIPRMVQSVIVSDSWRLHPTGEKDNMIVFTHFREFVEAQLPEGLGIDFQFLRRLCADRLEVLDLIEQIDNFPGRGGDRRSVEFKRDNVTVDKYDRGNSLTYALRRLRKEAPELLEKVFKNEISANAAMIEAGIKKPSIYITRDPAKAALILVKHFKPEEIAKIIELLLLQDRREHL